MAGAPPGTAMVDGVIISFFLSFFLLCFIFYFYFFLFQELCFLIFFFFFFQVIKNDPISNTTIPKSVLTAQYAVRGKPFNLPPFTPLSYPIISQVSSSKELVISSKDCKMEKSFPSRMLSSVTLETLRVLGTLPSLLFVKSVPLWINLN